MCVCVCLKNRYRLFEGGRIFVGSHTALASLILGLAAVAPLRRGGQMAKKNRKKTELQGDDTTV